MKLVDMRKWFAFICVFCLLIGSCKKQQDNAANQKPDPDKETIATQTDSPEADSNKTAAEGPVQAKDKGAGQTEAVADDTEEAATADARSNTGGTVESIAVPEGYVPLELDLPRAVFEGTPQDLAKIPNIEPISNKPRPLFYVPQSVSNVAAGKEVAGSDDESLVWGEYSQITDGDKEAVEGSYIEMSDGLQWVQVDLGAKHEIYAVLVWHYHQKAQVYEDVVVQLSNDKDFAGEVNTIYNNDHDNSAGLGIGKDMHYVETNQGRLIAAHGHTARFVRLYSNGNNANPYNHYIEVEVYGKPVK